MIFSNCYARIKKKHYDDCYYLESSSKSPKIGRYHSIPHKWESRRCRKIYRCLSCAKQIAFMSSCQRCTVCK